MGWTVNPLGNLRRFESCSPHKSFDTKKADGTFVIQNFIEIISGSSSVGRATAFQAVGRGFEPRLPLFSIIEGQIKADVAQG